MDDLNDFQGQDGTEVDGQGDQQQQENSGNSSGHPAWQELLSEIPESLHPLVTPHLQKWDQGVNERFQSLHSQYEPWQDVIEGADPEIVQQALGLVQRLEEDPEFVFKTLGNAYGFLNEQGTTGQQQVANEYDSDDEDEFGDEVPNAFSQRFSEMENVINGLAQHIQAQQQQEQQAQAINAYTQAVEQMHQKYGAFDDDVIDAMVAQGVGLEAAVQRYQNSVKQAAQQINAPASTAPVVMGGSNGGSGLPSPATSPGKLSSQDTKALVIQMLQQDQQS